MLFRSDSRQLVLQDNEARLPKLVQELRHGLPITKAPVLMISWDVDDRNARRLTELLRPRKNDRNPGTLISNVSGNNDDVRALSTDRLDCAPCGRRRISQMGIAQLNNHSSVPLIGQSGNSHFDPVYKKHVWLNDCSLQEQDSDQSQSPEWPPVPMQASGHPAVDSSSLHDVSVMNVSSGRHRKRTGRWLIPIPALT